MAESSGNVYLLTCVTNAGGIGPGHTALVVNETVYSFEIFGIDALSSSGWLIIGLADYMARNEDRPVILQELSQSVSTSKVLAYISQSIQNDDDYGGSGVCSSQAAAAIQAGMAEGTFNTLGIDKPYELYQLAKKQGLVVSEQMIWKNKDEINWAKRNSCQWVLDRLYEGYSWMLM